MMKTFASYLKYISFSLFVFLALLAITNWLCGIHVSSLNQERRNELPNYAEDPVYAQTIFDDYHNVGHRYKPFAEWQMLPYEGKTLHINEQGLRDHALPPGATHEPIIRFFGGSTMWGEGSDDTNTIPALVHQKINSGTVVNHAQLAYNSRQSLDALISMYSQGEKADVVIYYDGVNDAAFLCPHEIQELPGHRLIPLFQEKIYGGKKQLILSALNNIFTENILILIRNYQNTRENKSSLYNCLNTDKGKNVARMIMDNWEMAHDLVISRGGKFIAVLQPVSYVGLPRLDHLELNEELGSNIRYVYQELKKLINERGHPWIYDFTNSLDGNDYFYIDFCHVSPKGNNIIADNFIKILSGDFLSNQQDSTNH
ncbi:MAG: hypothetical protein ABL895_14115 [Cyclobacteriaceae bacterium]